MKKKAIALVLACVMCVGIGIGGTLAWLTAKTSAVTNTFTVGDIELDLYEHLLNADGSLKQGTEEANITRTGINDYKIVPSVNLNKDPQVVVKAGSEACWLFVKVEEANWPTAAEADGTRKVSYAIDAGWKSVPDVENVYYREVGDLSAEGSADAVFPVLANNRVTVSNTLTKSEMEAITVNPTLKFTAYACQKDNVTTVADAWVQAQTAA